MGSTLIIQVCVVTSSVTRRAVVRIYVPLTSAAAERTEPDAPAEESRDSHLILYNGNPIDAIIAQYHSYE